MRISLPRAIAERVLRNLVFRRRFPPSFGSIPLLATPSAGTRFLFRPLAAIDPTLLSLISEWVRPGDVVWDVGANIGFFSFPAAHKAGQRGQVFAIEPDTWLVRLLRKSAKLQPPTSACVTVLQCAIASSLGVREFCLAARARSANYLAGYGSSQSGGEREKHSVVTVPLDSLLGALPAPNILKIDTEGAELEVLLGARTLIASCRPVVICEVGGENSSQVHALLVSLGYQILDGDKPHGERRPLPHAPWNTLALPGQTAPAATSSPGAAAPRSMDQQLDQLAAGRGQPPA